MISDKSISVITHEVKECQEADLVRGGDLVTKKYDGRTTRTKIYEALKSEIFDGNVESLEVLVVDDLAKRFGVSRTPVREALLTLANEGLLEARHHVGFIVTSVNAKEIIETYSLRILLEKESVRLATRNMSDDGSLRLRELAEGVSRPDGRHFHAFIAALSGWGVLAEMLETLMDKTARSRALFTSAPGITSGHAHNEKFSHLEIYGAMASGEEEEAASLMELHLREAQKYILRAISSI